MASSTTTEHERRNQALKIISNPVHYQVCEGCGSIVTASTSTCPNCHGYLFDNNAERVVRQAKELSKRVPRSVCVDDLI